MSHPAEWNFDPDVLERSWRAWAIVDMILFEKAWVRTYTFNAHRAIGHHLGKLDNGGGDTICALFTPAGTVVKCFDHESKVSRHARDDFQPWPGIYEGMPQELWAALNGMIQPSNLKL